MNRRKVNLPSNSSALILYEQSEGSVSVEYMTTCSVYYTWGHSKKILGGIDLILIWGLFSLINSLLVDNGNVFLEIAVVLYQTYKNFFSQILIMKNFKHSKQERICNIKYTLITTIMILHYSIFFLSLPFFLHHFRPLLPFFFPSVFFLLFCAEPFESKMQPYWDITLNYFIS